MDNYTKYKIRMSQANRKLDEGLIGDVVKGAEKSLKNIYHISRSFVNKTLINIIKRIASVFKISANRINKTTNAKDSGIVQLFTDAERLQISDKIFKYSDGHNLSNYMISEAKREVEGGDKSKLSNELGNLFEYAMVDYTLRHYSNPDLNAENIPLILPVLQKSAVGNIKLYGGDEIDVTKIVSLSEKNAMFSQENFRREFKDYLDMSINKYLVANNIKLEDFDSHSETTVNGKVLNMFKHNKFDFVLIPLFNNIVNVKRKKKLIIAIIHSGGYVQKLSYKADFSLVFASQKDLTGKDLVNISQKIITSSETRIKATDSGMRHIVYLTAYGLKRENVRDFSTDNKKIEESSSIIEAINKNSNHNIVKRFPNSIKRKSISRGLPFDFAIRFNAATLENKTDFLFQALHGEENSFLASVTAKGGAKNLSFSKFIPAFTIINSMAAYKINNRNNIVKSKFNTGSILKIDDIFLSKTSDGGGLYFKVKISINKKLIGKNDIINKFCNKRFGFELDDSNLKRSYYKSLMDVSKTGTEIIRVADFYPGVSKSENLYVPMKIRFFILNTNLKFIQ